MVGGRFETGEHPLLAVGLMMDVLRLIETVVIDEEGEVFDQCDTLFGIFVAFHDAYRNIGINIDHLGTC